MKNKVSDNTIIAGLKNNDSRALGQLMDQYYAALCYFADGLIAHSDEAEDIVITTFTKFWNLRNNFEGIPNIRAFLYITTRNACFNYLKMMQRRAGKEKEISYLLTAENEEDAELVRVRAEVMRQLLDEVNKLPKKCRNIMLQTLEGKDTREIAALLEISEANVRNQMKVARKLLRVALLKQNLFSLLLLLQKI